MGLDGARKELSSFRTHLIAENVEDLSRIIACHQGSQHQPSVDAKALVAEFERLDGVLAELFGGEDGGDEIELGVFDIVQALACWRLQSSKITNYNKYLT
jgi:hypothetical protein